jgi:hypothetical protein
VSESSRLFDGTRSLEKFTEWPHCMYMTTEYSVIVLHIGAYSYPKDMLKIKKVNNKEMHE